MRKAGEKDGATLAGVDGEKNIFVGHGESVQGAVPKFGFAYYQTFMNDPKADLKVRPLTPTLHPDLKVASPYTLTRPIRWHHPYPTPAPTLPLPYR